MHTGYVDINRECYAHRVLCENVMHTSQSKKYKETTTVMHTGYVDIIIHTEYYVEQLENVMHTGIVQEYKKCGVDTSQRNHNS